MAATEDGQPEKTGGHPTGLIPSGGLYSSIKKPLMPRSLARHNQRLSPETP